MEGDVDLASFNLTHDDYLYKIPYIQMAKNMSEKEVKNKQRMISKIIHRFCCMGAPGLPRPG